MRGTPESVRDSTRIVYSGDRPVSRFEVAPGYQVNIDGVVLGQSEALPDDLAAERATRWQTAGYIRPIAEAATKARTQRATK